MDRAPSDASQPILVPRLALRVVLLAHHGSSSLVYLSPCSHEQKARRLQPPRLVVAPPAEQPPHVFKGPYLMALSSRTRHSPNHRRHIESVTSGHMLRSTWRAREATALRPSQSATASRAWWCPRDEAERASALLPPPKISQLASVQPLDRRRGVHGCERQCSLSLSYL